MALETCAENRSAPAVPGRQMDEMKGERRRSWGLAAAAIRRAGVADLGPSAETPALVPLGRGPASAPALLKPLCALKIERSLCYAKSNSSGAPGVQFPEYTNTRIHQRRGNQTDLNKIGSRLA